MREKIGHPVDSRKSLFLCIIYRAGIQHRFFWFQKLCFFFYAICGSLQFTPSSYLDKQPDSSESFSILWAWHLSCFIVTYMTYHSWTITSPKLGGILGKPSNHISGVPWVVISSPQGTFENIWRHFWLLQLREKSDIGTGQGCCKHLKTTEHPLRARII